MTTQTAPTANEIALSSIFLVKGLQYLCTEKGIELTSLRSIEEGEIEVMDTIVTFATAIETVYSTANLEDLPGCWVYEFVEGIMANYLFTATLDVDMDTFTADTNELMEIWCQ